MKVYPFPWRYVITAIVVVAMFIVAYKSLSQTDARFDALETQVHAIEDAIHCTGGSVPILVDTRVVGCQMPH
jgi:hypothetical protein